MYCRHDVLAYLGRCGLRESTLLKLGGVETHARREVIGFSERSPREKKKAKGMNSVHGRERNE